MKKLILSSLMFATLLVSLASCSDDTNSGGASCFNGLNEMTVINGLIFLLVITGK